MTVHRGQDGLSEAFWPGSEHGAHIVFRTRHTFLKLAAVLRGITGQPRWWSILSIKLYVRCGEGSPASLALYLKPVLPEATENSLGEHRPGFLTSHQGTAVVIFSRTQCKLQDQIARAVTGQAAVTS